MQGLCILGVDSASICTDNAHAHSQRGMHGQNRTNAGQPSITNRNFTYYVREGSMSYRDLQTEIRQLLEANGPMGVNEIQKAVNIPLSTLQKYLDKQQSYFKKNSLRKWVLPEAAIETHNTAVANNYNTIISSNIQSMNVLIETLMSQFNATITLMETQSGVLTSVAEKPDIDERLYDLDKSIQKTLAVFHKYYTKCPEEYKDLIKNVDLYALTIDHGTKYLNGDFTRDITGLFLEQTGELTEETTNILKTYQKIRT